MQYFNILRGNGLEFPKYDVFLTMKIVLMLANSADPDDDAFHLSLQYLPKCPLTGFQYIKG